MRLYRNPRFWAVWLLAVAAASLFAYGIAVYVTSSFPPTAAHNTGPANQGMEPVEIIERSDIPVRDTITPYKDGGRRQDR